MMMMMMKEEEGEPFDLPPCHSSRIDHHHYRPHILSHQIRHEDPPVTSSSGSSSSSSSSSTTAIHTIDPLPLLCILSPLKDQYHQSILLLFHLVTHHTIWSGAFDTKPHCSETRLDVQFVHLYNHHHTHTYIHTVNGVMVISSAWVLVLILLLLLLLLLLLTQGQQRRCRPRENGYSA